MDAPAFNAPPGQRSTDDDYDEAPAPRDYFAEALRIVNRRTLLIPERAHLIALYERLKGQGQ